MSYSDYIAGWNVGYWNGRMDELMGRPYITRSTDIQLELALVDGALVMPGDAV